MGFWVHRGSSLLWPPVILIRSTYLLLLTYFRVKLFHRFPINMNTLLFDSREHGQSHGADEEGDPGSDGPENASEQAGKGASCGAPRRYPPV